MSTIPLGHLRHQGANLAALGRVALGAAQRRPPELHALPGPLHEATVAPIPPRLVADFARWTGAEEAPTVPPWMFPQWGLPMLARTLDRIPWKVSAVVNQGCAVTVRGPLPLGEPLQVRAQLIGVEQTERRARMHQRLTTGPASQPDAVVADVFAVVRLARGQGRGEPPTVPDDHTVLGPLHVGPRAGWEFALLTGDFNPIHWIGPAARMAGFQGVILHGFGTLAIAAQRCVDGLGEGDMGRIASLDVRFVRPVTLPAQLAVLAGPPDGLTRPLAVGAHAGAVASLLGSVTLRDS